MTHLCLLYPKDGPPSSAPCTRRPMTRFAETPNCARGRSMYDGHDGKTHARTDGRGVVLAVAGDAPPKGREDHPDGFSLGPGLVSSVGCACRFPTSEQCPASIHRPTAHHQLRPGVSLVNLRPHDHYSARLMSEGLRQSMMGAPPPSMIGVRVPPPSMMGVPPSPAKSTMAGVGEKIIGRMLAHIPE
jgi:hypothetical protein